ncbi:hypothetical protein ACAG39_06305 [Caldicellulosiruptoraceae bacterium PP1]
MNYNEKNNQEQCKHEELHKGHGRHMLLMVLCCAIPIVLLLLLPILRVNSPAIKNILSFGVLLLCPLMHFLMMFIMHRNDKGRNQQGLNSYKNQDENNLFVGQLEDGNEEN